MALDLPPLCIIQARYHSTRLPGKMLLTLPVIGGVDETLIRRARSVACEAFGKANVIVAIPAADIDGPLGVELEAIGASIFAWDGPEADVLGRFYHCAHTYRWHPQSVIVRYTPDDPFKDVEALRLVAAGVRLPVEIGGEAFTLAQLTRAQQMTHADDATAREHLSNNAALFACDPPPVGEGRVWTIDTAEDYERAKAEVLAHA